MILHTLCRQQIKIDLYHRSFLLWRPLLSVNYKKRVRCVHLVVAVIRISALHFPLTLFKVPNISTDPPMVTNQTSATLTCNLTDSSLHIKGSHWLFNGKPVEKSESTSSDSFTRLRWVATWRLNARLYWNRPQCFPIIFSWSQSLVFFRLRFCPSLLPLLVIWQEKHPGSRWSWGPARWTSRFAGILGSRNKCHWHCAHLTWPQFSPLERAVRTARSSSTE